MPDTQTGLGTLPVATCQAAASRDGWGVGHIPSEGSCLGLNDAVNLEC